MRPRETEIVSPFTKTMPTLNLSIFLLVFHSHKCSYFCKHFYNTLNFYLIGANGLNLVEATHVFLIDPLLNPAAEAQAINRVHRIGQTKVTLIHRFIVGVFLFSSSLFFPSLYSVLSSLFLPLHIRSSSSIPPRRRKQ
jgi:hypothetical protein